MADLPTDVPGAEIRRINGQDYVVVTISKMFPGPPPTIAGLATKLHLQTDLVFHTLLGYVSNAPAVRALHRQQVGGALPDLEEARRALRRAGTRFTADGRFPNGTETPYIAWGVTPENNAPVVLPLSDGFRKVMREATAARDRETRLKALSPTFTDLQKELLDIRSKATQLNHWIKLYDTLSENHSKELAILEALDGLLGVLLKFPKASVSASDLSEMEGLRQKLATLKSEAYTHLIVNPLDAFLADLVKNRNQDAAALKQMVEASAFVEHIRALSTNRDIAPSQLWTDAIDVARFAFLALLASPEAERVLDGHVLPMIQALASQPFDLTGLSAPNHPDFNQAVRDVGVSPPANTVLVILVSGAGLATQAIGNYPGPNTLAVSLMELAAPMLMARVVGNAQQAGRMAGLLYRALVNAASVYSGPQGQPLSQNVRVMLIQAIDQGDLSQLRRINWSSRFMSGAAWGAAIAIASAICLIVAIDADDANTLRKWSNIIASASGTAVGVSVALVRYSALIRDGIVRGIGGKVLGVVGGIAAVVSGTVTAIELYKSGDTVGMWISIAGATGGALSVAGFLVAAGAGTTATVAGAPLGVVLMAAGVIIGIGAGVVSLVRSLTTPGSQIVFQAFLDHFGRQGGPHDTAAKQRPSLQQAFQAVQSEVHNVSFWKAHADKIPQLFDLGFSQEAIQQIVDENESVVTNSLRASKRIP